MKYCEAVFKTKRWKTREVMVGSVGVGGKNPVRIQSMTTSNTRDVEATAQQIMRLSDMGCEIARVTVQGMKEAEACEQIKDLLIQKGYMIPLVADIHFFPPAAMRVVDFVDKVRINPGNYVDKRASFKVIEYDDESYLKELERIEEKFVPLVEKCKTLKRAMRIGTNHGSLSDRVMNRYGDTPEGMVESALEYARICRHYEYHDFIFSMKSSSPQVMIQAYRLLVAKMMQMGWDYPLHLGVTEAGEGEDGRVKSAMGIGSLLLDGLGDTIRVSLTEDPWFEIDPCQRLIRFSEKYEGRGVEAFEEKHRNIQEIKRRTITLPKKISFHRDGTVIVNAPDECQSDMFYKELGCDVRLGKPKLKKSSVDNIFFKGYPHDVVKKKWIENLREIGVGVFSFEKNEDAIPLLSLKEARGLLDKSWIGQRVFLVQDEDSREWDVLKQIKPDLIILRPEKMSRIHYSRQFFDWLQENRLPIPVILNFTYSCSNEDLIIQASAECGSLLCDGLGDGIWLEAAETGDFLRNLSFNILQSARMRSFKTDFISCPSCGRTLFDLQDVSRRIRSKTAHLPGVKIAIMGCIVNGPGEMADADFGYVGSKPGKIDLYVGKQCVEKDIDFSEADDRLIKLIKDHGRWVEEVLT